MSKNEKELKKVSEREFIKIRLSGLELPQEMFFKDVLSKVKDKSPTLAFKRILNMAMAIKKWQVSGETLTATQIPDPQCGWCEEHPYYKRPICWRYITKTRFPSTHVILNAIIENETFCRDCRERDKRHEEADQLKKVKSQKTKVLYIQHPTKSLEAQKRVIEEQEKGIKQEREYLDHQKEFLCKNVDKILKHIPDERFRNKVIRALGNLDRKDI